MLLKLIEHPPIGSSVSLPVVKEETYIHLHGKLKVYLIDIPSRRTGIFDNDPRCPKNAVAVVEYSNVEKKEHIFITEDQEAYIIGNNGDTVLAINPPKPAHRHKYGLVG